MIQAAILALFFFSGACTLVYEVVWARMLIPVFGVGVYAVSTVLTAFMAGLALGSFYFGRYVDRKPNGLRLYAVLELGIGAFALLFPVILAGLDEVYTAIYRSLGQMPTAFVLARFAISFLVLLVPTTLMGATLPVLCKFAVRQETQVSWAVGRLYAVNTFGGAAGAFAAAFVLIEWLGVNGTIWAAAAVNVLIAALAWSLWRGGAAAGAASAQPQPARLETTEVTEPELASQPPSSSSSHLQHLVLVSFALSGFTALAYEVVWARLLSMVLVIASAQALSTILVAFLCGLAGGGAVGAKLADRWSALRAFAVVELLIGVFGLVSLIVISAVPLLLRITPAAVAYETRIFKLFAAAFAVMLIPTFLMGMLFPLVARLRVSGLSTLGSRIGDVYGVNTVGAIFGAFAAGFILIPLAGTKMSIDLLAWLNVLVGLVLLIANPSMRRRGKIATGGSFALVALALTMVMPSDMMRILVGWADRRGSVIHFDEDVGGTVSVHDYGLERRVLKVNGGSEVPTTFASLQTFRLLGTLPLVLHEAPEDVLVIAFGGGITLAAAESQGPKHIDCVEVVPAVTGAAEHFAAYNNRIFERFESDHLDIIVDDGRNHVLRTDQRYDVILSDATHPGTADSWVLYTEEFYRLCRDRLRRGGMVAQWLPLHGLSVDDFKMVLRTFRAVYPHATLWLTDIYAVMLGTPDRLQIDLRDLRNRLSRPAAAAGLQAVALGEPVSFVGTLALDETGLAEYVGQGPTNTDDRPYISFSDRQRGYRNVGAPALRSLIPYLCESPVPYVTNSGADYQRRLERRFEARRHTLSGAVAFMEGRMDDARGKFTRAVAVDPGEENAVRFLRRLKRDSPP